MKQRPILNEQQLRQASHDLLKLGGNLPIVITVTEGTKIRSEGQNRLYWQEVQYFMSELNEVVDQAAERSGHTNFEIRKIVGEQLPIEQAVILFCRTKESIHDCLKSICGIPTSTKLGSKEFMKFTEILAQTMSEIIGAVRSALR